MKRALIFDSGVGGLSVFDAVRSAGLPIEIDYAADNAWLPYGEKSDAALRERVPALIAALVAELKPDIVILACNTASTIALEETRAALTAPVVGVVPPIKPAAEQTRTGVIGILATPATVRRPYTDVLIRDFAPNVHVIRVGDARLVAAAEAKLAGHAPPPGAIEEAVAALTTAPRGDDLDVVALACTHFPLLKEELAAAAPRQLRWLDSGAAIARRVAAVLNIEPGGETCAGMAAFTGPVGVAAFVARGFGAGAAIGAAPAFALSSRSVLTDT